MSKSTLKDFEVLTRLGKGSFGTVHKVRRRADKNIYVMKMIPINQMDHRGQQDAINEVHILASLNHPYVVKYYDSFIENKTLHIVMEFCDKGDLSGVIRAQMGRLLPEAKVWKFLIQMCFGLEYIHSMKILHRDIKTMNVFLVREDSLRIGDLGVAKKLMNTAAFAHTIVGTPYYLSPELCEDKPYNIKSDMWALGCVLYELCTLKHPFDANNQGALFMKIIRASYAPVSNQYSAELRQLLEACLHKDYKKRPSAATILSRPGMKERTIGLNIAIPEGSAMSGTAVQLPPSPPSDTPHHSKHSSRGLLTVEEEKPPKKPAEKKPTPVPKVSVGPKAHQELADLQVKKPIQSPVMKAVPKSVIDLAPGKVKVESKQPVSNPPKSAPISSKPQRIHEQAPQRIRKGAPNAMARNAQQKVIKPPTSTPQVKQPIPRVKSTQPSVPAHSGAEPKSISDIGNQEELDEIKQVLNLPEYTGKKKLSVSDIREEPRPAPQPVSQPWPIEEIKTEPWKPQENLAFPEFSDPPVYDPLDVEEVEDPGTDGEAEHLSEEGEELDRSGSHSPDETINGREVRGMQVDSRT